jgi:heme/copper-type cytochrome/quinol oxidase subunit 3
MAAPLRMSAPALTVRKQRLSGVTIGAGLWATSALLVVAAIVGAWTSLRADNGGLSGFRPEGIDKFNYMSGMVLAAASMVSLTAEWFVWAVKKDERRQAAQSLGLAIGLLGAMAMGIVELARRLGVEGGSDDTIYSILMYCFLAAAVVTVVAGVAAAIVGLFRTAGRQIGPLEPQLARATAIVLHVPAIVWMIVWACVYAASR